MSGISLTLSSTRRSSPVPPGSASRGARLMEVAKRALPRPPRPPSPPSPPSGPPRCWYFSRRNDTQPASPSPPRKVSSSSSTNTVRSGRSGGAGSVAAWFHRVDVHLAVVLEADHAVDEREQGVVL